MATKGTVHNRMRIYHRYLGYFLAGIMAVYATSGVVMIFRDTDVFKVEKKVEKQLHSNLSAEELGKAIRIRDLKVKSESGDLLSFGQGTYNKATGVVIYTAKVVTSCNGETNAITQGKHLTTVVLPEYFLWGVVAVFCDLFFLDVFTQNKHFQKRIVFHPGRYHFDHRIAFCIRVRTRTASYSVLFLYGWLLPHAGNPK